MRLRHAYPSLTKNVYLFYTKFACQAATRSPTAADPMRLEAKTPDAHAHCRTLTQSEVRPSVTARVRIFSIRRGKWPCIIQLIELVSVSGWCSPTTYNQIAVISSH